MPGLGEIHGQRCTQIISLSWESSAKCKLLPPTLLKLITWGLANWCICQLRHIATLTISNTKYRCRRNDFSHLTIWFSVYSNRLKLTSLIPSALLYENNISYILLCDKFKLNPCRHVLYMPCVVLYCCLGNQCQQFLWKSYDLKATIWLANAPDIHSQPGLKFLNDSYIFLVCFGNPSIHPNHTYIK